MLKQLYCYVKSGNVSESLSEKDLKFSIQKTYDLYLYLFTFIPEIVDYASFRIELGKQKHFPTEEERNPNTKFVDNEVAKLIAENAALVKYSEKNAQLRLDAQELVKRMYSSIIQRDYYQEYMNNPSRSFQEDKKLIEKIFLYEFEDSEELALLLEDQSIYWTDELGFVLGMIIKTVAGLKKGQAPDTPLLPLYKDADDEEFVLHLFRHACRNYQDYSNLISEHTKNWEIERIAFMDILILIAAISEAVEFPNIPLKVTIDEYIELSKFYSTPNSSVFVNGVLDKIVNDLKSKNLIQKTGRGLVETQKINP